MVDQKLLWRAWPTGYLAKRGIFTIGGWTCVDVGGAGEGTSRWWRSEPDADGLTDLGLLVDLPDARVNAGQILPLVDPSDTATWAILLADLAEAVGGDRRWALRPENGLVLTHRYPYWRLSDGERTHQWECQQDRYETVWRNEIVGYPSWQDDLASALVTLRIFEHDLKERRP